MITPGIVRDDPYLEKHADVINNRLRKAHEKEKQLTENFKCNLSDFALGYRYYGLHFQDDKWVLREWAPNACKIYLIGDFSGWKLYEDYSLNSLGNGDWGIELPGDFFNHLDLYKLHICWDNGSGDRIPAWAHRVVQNPVTHVFNAQVWCPEQPYQWKNSQPKGSFEPLIYEAHVGMATEEYKVGTFDEFRTHVLPKIVKAGYNTLQLMAIKEHPYYGSFGYHVSNFFAVSSRFGTPDELKALVDEAHGYGLRVIMDIVHSHAVKNEVEGISCYDGTYYQFFHQGERGFHPAWDSRCFDYGKNEVIHFLLSNCKYWLEEFRFDGFRFDGITSMLYLDHGLGTQFMDYQQYFDGNQDEDAITYLHLANKLIHEFNPSAVTVAEEMSGMPGVATPQRSGGIGFDYRMAMGVPDFWIKTIKETRVEFWQVGDIFHNLTNKRHDEKTIHYAESHDQALVGDKTIFFWLTDQEIYYNMHVDSKSLTIDAGIALHKMIRLVTIATAGNGYLNFMGNEFGHPEWIDFPGEHNNWSHHYARRQWSLVDNENLRYRFLAEFDRDMIHLFRNNHILRISTVEPLVRKISDQILVFMRGDFIFAFNFSPFHSYTDYMVPCNDGHYEMVLNSDAEKYNGHNRLDETITYHSMKDNIDKNTSFIKLYLPAQTAFVLQKI